MFAYCNNCPLTGSDPSGNAIRSNIVICNDGNNNPYGDRTQPVPEEYEDGWYYEVAGALQTVDNFIYNDNAAYCKEHFFSFYKGAPVFRVESALVRKLGLTSWSFGVIVLNNMAEREDFEQTLRHEYGHTVQLSNMGIVRYTSSVAVPSIMNNLASRSNDTLGDLYYCMPWERTADYLGDVAGRYAYNPSSALIYNDPQWVSFCLHYFGG